MAKRQRQRALLVRCDERTELNNSRVQRRTNELISRRPSTSFAVSLFSPILGTTGSLPYRGTAAVGGWKFMTETFCSTRRGQSARCIVGRALNARNMAATCSQDISYRARTQRRFFLCYALPRPRLLLYSLQQRPQRAGGIPRLFNRGRVHLVAIICTKIHRFISNQHNSADF